MVSFLDLPVEVRDMVYKLALESRSGYVLLQAISDEALKAGLFQITPCQPYYQCDDIEHDKTNYSIFTGERINLALLQTCRQIHHEASSWFWVQNTFCFDLIDNFLRLERLDLPIAHHISKLMIDCGCVEQPAESRGWHVGNPWEYMKAGIVDLAQHARQRALTDLTLRLSAETIRRVFLEQQPHSQALAPIPIPNPDSSTTLISSDLFAFLTFVRTQLEDVLSVRKLLIEGHSLDIKYEFMTKRRASLPVMETIIQKMHEAFGGQFVVSKGDLEECERRKSIERREVVLWNEGKRMRAIWEDNELDDTEKARQYSQFWAFVPLF